VKRTLLVCLSLVLSYLASALDFLNTSFEAAEGFTTGALDSQNGWNALGGFSVVDTIAKSGTQSVEWDGSDGAWFAWASIPGGYSGAEEVTGSVSIFLDPASATVDRVYGLALWNDFDLVVGITLCSDGTIRGGPTTSDLWDGSGIGTYSSSAIGAWIDISLAYIPGETTAMAKVGNNSFALDATPASNLTDFDLYSDYVDDFDSSSIAYYDNYRVGTPNPVPEPVSMAVLGVGLLVLSRRKKA